MDDILARLVKFGGFFRADLLAPLGFLIAIAVTIHVLLNKRDIGATTAWIGLAWLAPVTGGLLYLLLGINRVRRRAQRLVARKTNRPRGRQAESRGWNGHLAPLERAGTRITGRRMLACNAFEHFENGDGAYPAMIAAIDGAARTVALSSYIFRGDGAGQGFIAALSRAHGRGVDVRVLVDGIGSGYFRSAAYHRLRREGIACARFMHSVLPWQMPFLNLRTHKKILVIDGIRGFTGGMNIGAENVLRGHPPPRDPVRDIHFAVRGPVVSQLAEAFARDWDFTTGEQLDLAVWAPDAPASGDAHARVATSGPDSDMEKIEYLMLQAVACARSRIRILTPYFLPEERLTTALGMAAMRGVSVEIVIPRNSNHRLVDWATRAHVGPLLDDGAKIFLNAPPFEHTKLMVVDGLWSLIGSANLDMRSLRLNFELNMEVYDETLAAEVERIVESRRGERLTREMLAARHLPVRLRDAATRLLLPYL